MARQTRLGLRALARGVVAASIASLLALAAPADAGATGGISGRVAGPDGEPLAGVEALVCSVPMTPPASGMFGSFPFTQTGFGEWASTSADGTYELSLEPSFPGGCAFMGGSYILVFSPPKETGFTPLTWRSSSSNSSWLVVEEGKLLTGVDAHLGPPASIAGRVTGTDGQPLVGATVVARYWMHYSPGDREWKTTTDDRGRYALTNLQDVEYYVQVLPADGSPSRVYYPGTADPVRIRPQLGQLMDGYDIAVPERGNLSFCSAARWSAWGFSSELGAKGYGDNNISRIDGLPPGEYRVATFPSSGVTAYYPGTFQQEDATPVTVRSGETTAVPCFSTPLGTLTGRVVDESGTPLAGVAVRDDDSP